MRRKNIDLSYKERTKDIVESYFDRWQLITKDEREGMHRYINNIVSISQEFSKEATYIESMFFPNLMDLTEEYILYTTKENIEIGELYYSGDLVTNTLRNANSIDDLIAGTYDDFIHITDYSGLPSIIGISAKSIEEVYIYNSGIVYNVDIANNNITNYNTINYKDITNDFIYVDTNNYLFPITEAFIESSIVVSNESGDLFSFDVYDSSNLSGNWVDKYDYDNNGIIWRPEKVLLDSSKGVSAGDMLPEDWLNIAWMDSDNDGIIGSNDYNKVINAYPSTSPDIFGFIEMDRTNPGKYNMAYEKNIDKPVTILPGNSNYTIITNTNTVLSDNGNHLTYDPELEVYYSIHTDNKLLKAFTYNDILNTITGTSYIAINYWNSSCYICGLDIHAGYIFVLVTDGIDYRIYYGDTHNIYIEELIDYAVISFTDFSPTILRVANDDYFILSDETIIKVFKPIRDKFLNINNKIVSNKVKDIKLEDDTDCTIIPSYVFNSFDSFAYSLGMDRPYGHDNYDFRERINDFYMHPHDNSLIGLNYGIIRELGFDNTQILTDDILYQMYNEMIPSGDITVNNNNMLISNITDDGFTISGEIGSINIYSNKTFTPDSEISSNYSVLEVDGWFLDNDDYPINIIETLEITKTSGEIQVEVSSLSDVDYLGDIGYYVSGEPTTEFRNMIETYENDSPFIYGNMLVNTMDPSRVRISETPITPTIYSPDITDIISSGEVEFTI